MTQVKVQAPKKPPARSSKKRKATATKAVHVLLDETGSMSIMKTEAIRGYNKYLDGLAGEDLQIALTKFDSTKVERVHGFVTPKDATRLTDENYIPGALTPLYDALATVIRQTEKEITGDALIVILTDGLENASHEMTKKSINELIKAQEAKGWNFLYLGVAVEAWANEAAFAGTNAAQNLSRSTGKRGIMASMDVATTYTARYASSAAGSQVTLSDEEKQKARDLSN